MTPQKQTEAMITLQYGKSGYSGYGRDYPDYMTDYNAVHRVLNGLDRITPYLIQLGIICLKERHPIRTFPPFSMREAEQIAKATPAEMTEAIVKGAGLWQPEETA